MGPNVEIMNDGTLIVRTRHFDDVKRVMLERGTECRIFYEEESSADCISRAAVLDLCDSKDPNYRICHFREDVECLPAVIPARRKGEWKTIQSGDKDFPESIVCSMCGHENSYFDFGISSVPIGKSFVKSKYCPNCGADMEEEENEDSD